MEGGFAFEAFKELGFGGVIGFLLGFTLKRVIKLFLFIIGLYIISLLWLADNGIVTVNWGALEEFIRSFGGTFKDMSQTLIKTASFGGGFAVGFAMGLKM